MLIPSKKRFRKVVIPPPDKAITQRAVIISVLTGGIKIINPSLCGDCVSALECVRALGAKTKISHDIIEITMPPIKDIRRNEETYKLNAGNSATSARLMMGVIAGLGIKTQITGDSSLRRRTMKLTLKALSSMGAKLTPTKQKCPVLNTPQVLKGIDFVASSPTAQTKSAVILAALNAKGGTTIQEPVKTRDHTEIMLSRLGFDVKTENNAIKVSPSVSTVSDPAIKVPGDISSAAFLIAAALLCKDGYAFIKDVGLNSTRMGMVNLLIDAGADIKFEPLPDFDGEPAGNIIVRSSNLNGFEIDALTNHSLIDEIPILAVIACFCKGQSVFKNLSVIKNKESNRMREIFKYLKKFGAQAELVEDTLIIEGNGLKNNAPFIEVKSEEIKPKSKRKKSTQKIIVKSKDHRIIMAFAVAGMLTDGCQIEYPHLVKVSYPEFFESLLG